MSKDVIDGGGAGVALTNPFFSYMVVRAQKESAVVNTIQSSNNTH